MRCFFHWLNVDALVILPLILCRISLLVLLIPDLAELISLQVGLLAKFGLRSFRFKNASMPSFVTILLFSLWMDSMAVGSAFL